MGCSTIFKSLNLLAALLLTGTVTLAQRTFQGAPSDNNASKKETTIIVTDTKDKAYAADVPEKSKTARNLHTSIKLNPLLIVNGDMPIYVEHKFAEKLTAEVSLGMTYANQMNDYFDEQYYPQYMTKQNETGYSYSAALRYYPSNSYETMEGYYFAPEFRNRVYKATATEYMTRQINEKQTKNISEVRILFGYTNYFEDHLFIDFYTGVGYRTKAYHNMLGEGSNIYTGQSFDANYTLYNDTKISPMLALGFKIGFSF